MSRLRRYNSTHEIAEAFPHGVDLKIIAIFTRDQFTDRWWFRNGDLLAKSAGELLSPVTLLLNTRQARTRAVHSRLSFFDDDFQRKANADSLKDILIHSKVDKLADSVKSNGLLNVVLDGTSFYLPLGWHLSAASVDNIQTQKLPLAASDVVAAELAGSSFSR